jgi:hypothetical protein
VSPIISSGLNISQIYRIRLTLCQVIPRVWLVGWLLFERQFVARKTVNFAGVRTWLGRGIALHIEATITPTPK